MLIQQIILALVVTCLPQNDVNEVCYVLPNGHEYGMVLESSNPEIGTLIPIEVTTIDDHIVATVYYTE